MAIKKLTTKDDVYGLLSAATAQAALGAAIETGLLWRLAEKPAEAAEIVRDLGIPGKRGYYWLQLLEGIGVLENGLTGYSPSALTSEAILGSYSRESWQHLALDERERSAGVHGLAVTLCEPGSIWAAQGLPAPRNYVEKMRDDPARAREFTRMLFEVHQPLAQSIAGRLDLAGVRRLMDLGGGSGVVSMALLRKFPGLTATVMDLENVCTAGGEIAAEQGLADRIRYQPVDFARDEFPAGFDAALQCDVGVFQLELFQKVFRSLLPGGRLILVEHVSPSEAAAPVTRVTWTFLDSLQDPDFSFPTLEQVQAMLAQAGFEVYPEAERLDGRWTVLEARRP